MTHNSEDERVVKREDTTCILPTTIVVEPRHMETMEEYKVLPALRQQIGVHRRECSENQSTNDDFVIAVDCRREAGCCPPLERP
jgi:hypothetical protein